MSKIDWDVINEKLPYERTDEAKKKRKNLFQQFDPNGNGYLSLAEVDRGIRDVLQSDDLFNCKPAISRAYHFARDKTFARVGDKHGPHYLEFREFRLFLKALRQYFEYFQAFDTIDTDDDRRISKEEFTSEKIKPIIEKWVGKIDNWDYEFNIIDTNDGGHILFSEFVEWAISKDLDIEGDED